MANPRNECPEPEPRRTDSRLAVDYALRLRAAMARSVGAGSGPGPPCGALQTRHPALEWARSGAMALTGARNGPPRLAPGHLAACCEGAALALRDLSPTLWPADFDAPALLGERAAIAGLERRGATSPGGSCRFVKCADGWIAVNLARPDDLDLLPAWLSEGDWSDPVHSDVWQAVARAARQSTADSLVARAQLLGLPAARAQNTQNGGQARRDKDTHWCHTTPCGRPRQRRPGDLPLVVDLSSLWAGPLCSQLLCLTGARVIKVESPSRPDGARFGPAAFFDLMNAGKQSLVLDLACPRGRQALRSLLAAADIVVESSRPRALKQLGIEAEASLRQTPGQVWLSITGYGRSSPEANWVALGDDAAVAAGLTLCDLPASSVDSAATGSPPTGGTDWAGAAPLFCGDAIADPLTGLHGAVAALASWHAGGGVLLDVALRNVVAHTLAFGPPPRPASVSAVFPASTTRDASLEPLWEVTADGVRQRVLPPRARLCREPARPLGADTNELLREFAARC